MKSEINPLTLTALGEFAVGPLEGGRTGIQHVPCGTNLEILGTPYLKSEAGDYQISYRSLYSAVAAAHEHLRSCWQVKALDGNA
jgi:hypothetical protein